MEEFVDLPSGKQLATDVDVDVRYLNYFFANLISHMCYKSLF